jgi:predicted alpha/beta hydrolase
MKGYGYPIDDEEMEAPIPLKEITLVCSVDEIERIIGFLSHVKKTHKEIMGISDYTHSHYRDWDKTWSKKEVDFIISTVKDDKTHKNT